jgi:formamidopyrimidine-DNA glycosylase
MTPRTVVFQIPDRDLQALVTILDNGVTLAFRPEHGSWGPPIASRSDSDDLRESATVYDATIRECPLCGGDLAARWDRSRKVCTSCGCVVRNGLVAT